ncbi:transposase [Nocardia terpenica]|uniref:transposase n=1 Tax=Nocardia terpenica TaxID=455432 RepID=UPI0012FD3EBC
MARLPSRVTRRPVDLLEDRTSGTVVDGLKGRLEVRVFCRVRGGPYADGARRGASDAIQVADCWHVMHNRTTAVDRVVRRHRRCLAQHQDTVGSGHKPITPELAAWVSTPLRCRHTVDPDRSKGATGPPRNLAMRN